MMRGLHQKGRVIAIAFFWLGLANTTRAGDFPKGTFCLKPSDGPEWVIKFDGKGDFAVTRDGKGIVEGTYKVTKDGIEFTNEKGRLADVIEPKPAIYKWNFKDKRLTFTKDKAKIDGRSAILTSGAWQMKGLYTDEEAQKLAGKKTREVALGKSVLLEVVPAGESHPRGKVFKSLGIDENRLGDPRWAWHNHVVFLTWQLSPSFELSCMTGINGEEELADPNRKVYGVRIERRVK